MKITNEKFVHLHCHTDRGSNIRMKDSNVKCEQLIQYANDLGNKAVAITDHESISAHILAVNTLNELKEQNKIEQDFKLILGNEIYLVNEFDLKKSLESKEKVNFYHCLLLAKDEIGHNQIRELSSRAWRDNYFSYKGMDRVPTYYSDVEEVIGDNKGHLICSTACLGSYLGTLSQELMQTEDEDEQYNIKSKMVDFIDWATDIFGDDFYLEMQPNKSEEQVFYNQLLVKMSQAYDIPMLITTDVHYLDESKKELHKSFLTSEENEANREVDDFYDSTRFFTTDEIYETMNYIDEDVLTEAMLNTTRIADMCEVGENNDYGLFKSTRIPLTPLPPKNEWYPVNLSIIENYEYIKLIYEDEYEYHTYLIHQIFRGLNDRKIPFRDMNKYLDRINTELEEIYKLSITMNEPIGAYLTTMQVNIEEIWKTSVVGVGRGSSVVEVIDYLLEITDIDPLKQGMSLPHWRFIHRSKVEMPDIDTDYASHLKNSVFYSQKQYYESIGGSVVRVCTFRTETSKSAILTACRGLHINNDIAQYISSLVKIERGFVWSISDMYYGNPEKYREPVTEFVNIVDEYADKNLLETMLSVEGLVTGIGSHASGIIPLNHPLEEISSYMRTPSGELITSFDLHEIEKCSGLKYDYLLTNGVSIIQLVLEMLVKYDCIEWQGSLRETYKKYLLPEVIGCDDPEVWDNICQGKIMNLFQFDSQVGKEAIEKLQPRTLTDLANANALMRLMNPDGEQPLDKYVRFKNDPQLWEQEMIDFGLNEEERAVMHELLDDEYGVCSNQESMMMMFMHPKVAEGFGVKEANIAKTGIAKKRPKVQKQFEKMLYENQEEKGLSKRLVDYCWQVETQYQAG